MDKRSHGPDDLLKAMENTAYSMLVVPFVIIACCAVAIVFLAPSIILKIFGFACVAAISLIAYCLSGDNNNG